MSEQRFEGVSDAELLKDLAGKGIACREAAQLARHYAKQGRVYAAEAQRLRTELFTRGLSYAQIDRGIAAFKKEQADGE